MDVRLFGTVNDSIVDGPGIRYAIFFQGCSHNCEGCHNPRSHDPAGGSLVNIDELIDEIRANKLLSGVTLTGGEPFEQPEAATEIARKVKALGLSVWVYSGYTLDELESMPRAAELLRTADVLVDGPYIASLRSLDLRFRGSSNQRIIELAKR